MGDVVAAEHLQLRHVVAIKLLSSQTTLRPRVVARFLREARAVVRFHSEHVARVLDVGTFDNGVPYIVMEYLEGTDFDQFIQNGGQMPAREAAGCIVQACEALAEAHAMGIIHRDLKPSNLFLAKRRDGTSLVKVLDFGISKIAENIEDETITQTTDILGTPAYMAPEQIKSAKSADERSDIWALGLILAECISGRPVYRGSTKLGVLARIAGDPVPDLGFDRVDVPPGLALVIKTCLEKDPANRFQSVAELATALSPFAGAGALPSIDRIEKVMRTSRARQRWTTGPAYRRAAWITAGLVLALLGLYAVKIIGGAPMAAPAIPSAQPNPAHPSVEPASPRLDPSSEKPAPALAPSAVEEPARKAGPKVAPPVARPGREPRTTPHVPAHGPSPSGLEDRK
jgi:serine/threonine-protein kinase